MVSLRRAVASNSSLNCCISMGSVPILYIKNKDSLLGRPYYLERVMGIEPTSQAWEARILPMNYTRIVDVL